MNGERREEVTTTTNKFNGEVLLFLGLHFIHIPFPPGSLMGIAWSFIHDNYTSKPDWTGANVPDLTGIVTIVTGGNTGQDSLSSASC